MSGVFNVVVDDRGGIVVPAGLRKSAGLTAGTSLVMVEAPTGLVLLSREQLKQRVRDDLRGLDLVTELLTERRNALIGEDAL